VLVQGAAGGVRTAALEVIAALGSSSVAVVSSDEKEAAARSLGADHVVRSTGGSIPELKVNRLLLRNLTVVGVEMVQMDQEVPGTIAMVNAAVERLAAEGKIKTLVGARLPLEETAEALRILERREAVGKVVVEVRR
jgi:NADPH2:quinone reductase